MKFSLNNSFFDLTRTIEKSFETLGYFGKQKNIQPKLIIDEDLKPFLKKIYCDEIRFT